MKNTLLLEVYDFDDSTGGYVCRHALPVDSRQVGHWFPSTIFSGNSICEARRAARLLVAPTGLIREVCTTSWGPSYRTLYKDGQWVDKVILPINDQLAI
jgi:hypothetical protein